MQVNTRACVRAHAHTCTVSCTTARRHSWNVTECQSAEDVVVGCSFSVSLLLPSSALSKHPSHSSREGAAELVVSLMCLCHPLKRVKCPFSSLFVFRFFLICPWMQWTRMNSDSFNWNLPQIKDMGAFPLPINNVFIHGYFESDVKYDIFCLAGKVLSYFTGPEKISLLSNFQIQS